MRLAGLVLWTCGDWIVFMLGYESSRFLIPSWHIQQLSQEACEIATFSGFDYSSSCSFQTPANIYFAHEQWANCRAEEWDICFCDSDITFALLVDNQKPIRTHWAALCCCLSLPKSCCAGSLIIWQLSETRGGRSAEITACVPAEPQEPILWRTRSHQSIIYTLWEHQKGFLGHVSWSVYCIQECSPKGCFVINGPWSPRGSHYPLTSAALEWRTDFWCNSLHFK